MLSKRFYYTALLLWWLEIPINISVYNTLYESSPLSKYIDFIKALYAYILGRSHTKVWELLIWSIKSLNTIIISYLVAS